MGLTLTGCVLGHSVLPVHGQNVPPPEAAPADLAKRLDALNRMIGERLDAGQITEAIAPARERLDLVERARGKDHWQTSDARRELETYQRLASLPREVQDRYAEARQTRDRAYKLYARGRYGEAVPLLQEVLTADREILGEDHPETALSYNDLGAIVGEQGKYAEAEGLSRRALEIRQKVLSEAHPDTAQSYNNLAMVLHYQGRYAEAEAVHRRALAIRQVVLGEDHRSTAISYNNVALSLHYQGKFAAAEVLNGRALAIRLKVLGEDHGETATSYSNLAETLLSQGKYAEAETLHRSALAIKLKVLGEDHPDTALSYNNVGASLLSQGKYAEAETLYRRALAIWLKVLGEDHPASARCYNNLAVSLLSQGKYAEAEGLSRRALALRLKALGEDHPDSAQSYNSLAEILRAQGKYAEAETLQRRSLAIALKVLGEDHHNTAIRYNNLALTLDAQAKYAEAEALTRRALAIRLKTLGEDHPLTASSYHNLAGTLDAQAKYAEAETLYRRALAIRLKVLGEDHPDTASSYRYLATTFLSQGKYAEAEALNRRALGIRLKVLGEDHPDSAVSYKNLALSVDRQERYDEALPLWSAAAASYERGRLRGVKGLESALSAAGSPLTLFALALARAGQPRVAWSRWEQGLARGLVDEVVGRATRPLSDAEHQREVELLGRSQAIDEGINALLARSALTPEQEGRLGDLKRQGSELRRHVLELEQELERKYGALAGQPIELEGAQKSLPVGTALVGWIDHDPDHCACLLRPSGDPVWVPLTGSGAHGGWTMEEQQLAQRLRAELHPESTQGNARALAAVLARQRLEPLKEHLAGTKRLIVVNSPGLAGVPVEALLAAQPDPAWDAITVSYAPSASMFAHVTSQPAPPDRVPTFLALADPAYPEPKPDSTPPPPPETGLPITRVVPNGNADLNGLRKGDVLLSYGGTAL
jgi:tetratricopeptide (TPR) repeat protein